LYNATSGKPKMVSGSKEKPNEIDRIRIDWSCNADRGCRLHGARCQSRGRPDLRYQYSPWLPRLEANLRCAREEGNLHSSSAILGNDLAIQAYREGKIPFPDGAIIAALHYRHVPSEENNKVFGQDQSFVAGTPTNIQFMVKDTKKYTATGGWGFAHFQDGKPGDEAFMKTCFPCHNEIKARDLVFTRYAQ
jgi:Cytochrome P460